MPKKKQYWSISKAVEEAGKQGIEVSGPTLIKWIQRYNIGFQLGDKGGKWYIFPEKFLRYINGGKNPKTSQKDENSNTAGNEGQTPIRTNAGQGKEESEGIKGITTVVV